MKNVIDLTAYLPAQENVPHCKPRNRFADAAAAVEGLVTVLIGAGFVTMLAAFFAAII